MKSNQEDGSERRVDAVAPAGGPLLPPQQFLRDQEWLKQERLQLQLQQQQQQLLKRHPLVQKLQPQLEYIQAGLSQHKARYLEALQQYQSLEKQQLWLQLPERLEDLARQAEIYDRVRQNSLYYAQLLENNPGQQLYVRRVDEYNPLHQNHLQTVPRKEKPVKSVENRLVSKNAIQNKAIFKFAASRNEVNNEVCLSDDNPASLASDKHVTLTGPSIGFEIEELPDWSGAGQVVLRDKKNEQQKTTYLRDTAIYYDMEIISTEETADQLGHPKTINLSVDSNRYTHSTNIPLRAGIEFRHNPHFLGNESSADPYEMLYMMEHLEAWRRREARKLSSPEARQTVCRKYILRLEDWVDEYNIEKQVGYLVHIIFSPLQSAPHKSQALNAINCVLITKGQPGLGDEYIIENEDILKERLIASILKAYPDETDKLAAFLQDVQKPGIRLPANNPLKIYNSDNYNEINPKHNEALLSVNEHTQNKEWCLELDSHDIKLGASTRYYTQINAAIPTRMLFSPEMRALFPLETEYRIADMEKEESTDFHVQRNHKKFMEYEADIYGQSVKLADDFFKTHLRNKIQKFSKDGSKNRKMAKVQAFLRTMVYQIAMLSISTDTLKDILSDDQELAACWVNTIGKDRFPNGLIKFSLHGFFNELLNDSDRAALLKINKRDIMNLCSEAIEISAKGKYDSAPLAGKIFDVSRFYYYTFRNKKVSQDSEIIDPHLTATYVERFIATSNYHLKTTEIGSRIKKAGVVEFRLPASKEGTITDVKELVTSSLARYTRFCDKISAERAVQKGVVQGQVR